MAPLRWHSLTWDEFVPVLQAFRHRFYVGRSDEEHAYLRARRELDAVPLSDLPDHVAEIVSFLNQWACRLPTEAAVRELRAWVREQERTLRDHLDSDILDPRVPRRRATYLRLHDSLLRFKKRGVNTMGDAAASKVLHQVNPGLFVMWDKQIKPYADDYGDFMAQMHHLGLRLRDSAPADARDDLETFLQKELGYPVRKPLAKYLDEYNWFVAVGGERVAP